MFESILDYRKIVLFLCSIEKDGDSPKECGFLKSDINCLNEELKNTLMEQNEEHLMKD